MVIDALARQFSGGKLNCDRGGKIAASGNVNRALLDELLRDPTTAASRPRAPGASNTASSLSRASGSPAAPLRDLVATATVLTAATIAMAVQRAVAGPADLIASGGGVHNPQIMAHLAGFLPGVAISTSTDHGIDADAKEAIAFAVLAHAARTPPTSLRPPPPTDLWYWATPPRNPRNLLPLSFLLSFLSSLPLR